MFYKFSLSTIYFLLTTPLWAWNIESEQTAFIPKSTQKKYTNYIEDQICTDKYDKAQNRITQSALGFFDIFRIAE